MTKQILTQEILKEHLHYNPNNGVFVRLIGKKAGYIAGSYRKSDGYLQTTILGKTYLNHRLAWLYVYGNFPKFQLDHINGVGADNRLNNLRECVVYENGQNRKLSCINTSGYTGVSYHKISRKWRSVIKYKNKKYELGYFDNPQLAHLAYVNAKSELHTFNPVLRES